MAPSSTGLSEYVSWLRPMRDAGQVDADAAKEVPPMARTSRPMTRPTSSSNRCPRGTAGHRHGEGGSVATHHAARAVHETDSGDAQPGHGPHDDVRAEVMYPSVMNRFIPGQKGSSPLSSLSRSSSLSSPRTARPHTVFGVLVGPHARNCGVEGAQRLVNFRRRHWQGHPPRCHYRVLLGKVLSTLEVEHPEQCQGPSTFRVEGSLVGDLKSEEINLMTEGQQDGGDSAYQSANGERRSSR